MKNIKGEMFNVWKTGNITLLRLPTDLNKPAKLLVGATVTKYQNDTRSCAGYLMSSFLFSGSWLGEGQVTADLDSKSVRLQIRVDRDEIMQGEPRSMNGAKLLAQDPQTLKIGVKGAELVVRVIDYIEGPYLNFKAKNIRNLPSAELGGILGHDDHSYLLKPECDVSISTQH